MDDYLSLLKSELQKAYSVAQEARSKGFDPADEIEVKIAKDVAARVEGIVGPPGISELIRSLEKGGMARENIAFEVTRRIAAGNVIQGTKEKLIEQAVRTGLAILTEGVLVAPTEGIAKVKIKNNPDGSDYVAVYYAGPIRSAGGTAAALSLVLADIARRTCKVGDYRATESQILRYIEEIMVYETRCVHLQYLPPEDDIKVIAGSCPVCISGDPTEEIEVSAYRGVPGVETNRVRGGVPLVMCEGVAAKAAKLLKYTKKLDLKWDWLEKIIKIKKRADKIEVKPDPTYLEGLVAGRPVFSHPSAKGGFRLRYGRSKSSGLMGKNVHPATMVLLDNFLAYGTHMKIERPGKGCVVAALETLEPPVVKLKSGRVMKVRTLEEAYAVKGDVEEVLFLGDMLCPYGDFLKSNHPLIPCGYCEEWWALELKGNKAPETMDAVSLFDFSRKHGIPLHPRYTYHWHDISSKQLRSLVQWLRQGTLHMEGERIREFTLPKSDAKRVLEELLIEHRVHESDVVLESDEAFALLSSLGALEGEKLDLSAFDASWHEDKKPLGLVNELSGIVIRAKTPTYIGAKMGRPEKAKERKMDGSPHVLFPTGSFKNRSISKQYRSLKSAEGEKTVNIELIRTRCQNCSALCFYKKCHICGSRAVLERIYADSGLVVKGEPSDEQRVKSSDRRPINIVELYESVRDRMGGSIPEVKGVKGLSNALRIPERLEKGFLRAKHEVYVFRDGTSRFDATDVTLTHFTPDEIRTSVSQLRKLGYSKDYLGDELERGDQTVTLRHQDILLSKAGAEYFVRVAAFIDDLLVDVYGMQPFYNIKTEQDLIGHLAVGLSPHTSAGALCRIIGFTDANVGYGHPYFHTAKRRNCFHGDERLLVHDGKGFELLTIRELSERHLIGQTKKDDFGTEYKEVRGLKTFAFNKKTKKFELADITHISKHLAPEKLLELKTKSGRKIVVTPDHPFPNRDGKKITAQDAEEVLIPWKIENPRVNSQNNIDLLSISEGPDVMIRTDEDVFGDIPLVGVSRDIGMSYKTFTNYAYRKSYPLGIVKRCNPDLIQSRKYLLGSKRDSVSVKPRVLLDQDFLSLLGFYFAEGYMKRNQKDTHQVKITAAKKWAKSFLKRKIESIFGITPAISGNNVTICSRYVYELFRHLGVGDCAKTKTLPCLIYSLPPDKIKAFLRGYFSGDGSCSMGSTLEVNVTSVNKQLIDSISYLLLFSGIKHSIREEKRMIKSDIILKFYGKPKDIHSFKIRIYGDEAKRFIETIGFLDEKQRRAECLLKKWLPKKGHTRTKFEGEIFIDKIIEKNHVTPSERHVYNLTVGNHHSLVCSGITAYQCDGDEDSVMLLMDALLNFSRHYLDERRGGTMDAPLVLSIEINPKEVDDEAHCIEFVSGYPLEFYEAAASYSSLGKVKIKTVKDVLGTPEQYELPITHAGGTLDVGNVRTAYVELQSIPDKIEIQFGLQERLRAVDSADAAERLILSHFIPDLYGNLRSYSRQTFRCVSCNTIYRRTPLAGKCTKCGGNLLLTINKGGIEKYLQISRDIVKRYELPVYLNQRLELVEKEIKSIFEDDKVKQMGLSDFL